MDVQTLVVSLALGDKRIDQKTEEIKNTGENTVPAGKVWTSKEDGAGWDDSKANSFDYHDYISGNIGGANYGLPVMELTGDMTGMSKDVKKDMSFAWGETSGTCKVKWQGSSSIYFPKKNFTVSDMSVAVDFGWGDVTKIVLKADYVDASHIRNVCAAKLWSRIVLSEQYRYPPYSYMPNAGAIDGFPVMLVLNGEYYGVYSLTIPKDENLFGGASVVDAVISAENPNSGVTGFWGLTSAENIESEADFGAEYISDDDTSRIATSLNTMIQSCLDGGANFESTVDQSMSIESAIDYLIFSILIGNVDGIGKNYILFSVDGTRWAFSAYDLDGTFGNHWYGYEYFNPNNAQPMIGLNTNALNSLWLLIFTHAKERFADRYSFLRSNVLSEENVSNLFYNYAVNIPSAVLDAERRMWTTLPGTNTNDVSQIVDWYRDRCRIIDAQVFDLCQIGKKNLFTGTKDFTGTDWNWAYSSWIDIGKKYKGLSIREHSGSWDGLSQNVHVSNGDILTLSAYIWAESGSQIKFYCENTDRSDTDVTSKLDTNGQFVRVVQTFKATASEEIQPRFENTVSGKRMRICGLQLARGYISQWTEAENEA